MSIEKGRAYLSQFGVEDKIKEFDVSSATVEAIIVVAAGDAKIDNPKYKATFSTKAKMLTPDEVESMIGHKVGGVCPFGINDGVKTYLDESLKRFETVFPAVGSSNSAVELTVDELEKIAQGFSGWVNVCKLPE